MATKDDEEAVRALEAMSPARRAAQLFAATLTNFGNKATFGGLGALGDLARGTDWGTTGGQIEAQVAARAPGAAAASTGLGYVAPGGLLLRGGKAALGLTRALPSLPGLGTTAKFLLPAGGAAVAAGMAGDSEVPAVAAVPEQPAVAQALESGKAAPYNITPRDQLNAYVASVLQGGATIREAQALGGLVEGTPKPRTNKDTALGIASQATDQQFAAELAAAEKLTDQSAKDAARVKATDNYRARYAALAGVNPQALTMADFEQGN